MNLQPQYIRDVYKGLRTVCHDEGSTNHTKMRSTCISIALCAQALTASAGITRYPADGLTVQTDTGPVTGFYNQSAPNVRQFLGLPFAQPPVGDLRFAPPLPAKLRSGTLNATAFAPSCMQKFSSSQTIYTQVVPEFLIEGSQSEDCLYLNVWAPEVKASEKSLLPVLLYIPGGGFTSGGANSIYKFPDQWIQRTQSHLVVVMKFVVGFFKVSSWLTGSQLSCERLRLPKRRRP